MLAIYMVGSDLEDDDLSGTNDLRELITGYNSLPDKQEVEVVVAFGGANKDGWRGMKFANMSQIIEDGKDRAQIIEDGKDSEFGNETGPDAYLYHNASANMDDEDSLKLFLDYIKSGYANFDQRFLTLWDHGNSYKGFGGDTNFDPSDPMSMGEIASAFRRSEVGEFDLIGFDACFMASVEVAKVVEPHADYMIASEESEPGHGWLWSEVIRYYAQQDGIVETGILMVDNFVQDVHGEPNAWGKTLSLLDLSEYDQLVATLNPVLSAYDRNLLSDTEYSSSFVYGSTRARSYGGSKKREEPPVSIDLKHFAQLLADRSPDADTKADIDELVAAIDEFVVHSAHDGSRPNSFGIAIDAPELEKYMDYSDYKVSSAWLKLEQEYSELLRNDTQAPTIVANYPRVDAGSLHFDPSTNAQFADRTAGPLVIIGEDHLAEVTGIYGSVKPVESNDGSFDDYFMVVAELEAYLTENENEYFVPEWNQYWFAVEYDPNKPTAWIPASFAGWFEAGDQAYTEYTAEIDFYRDGQSDPELAVMTLVVDGYVDGHMEVVWHYINTYQEDENGEITFARASYEIIPGNAIQFWNYGFNLNYPADDTWFPTGDGIVSFTQEPDFRLEHLKFRDGSGHVLGYEYGIWAEDASGNPVLYGPFPTSPRMAIYEDPWEYFAVEVPADWIEENSDTANYEVFRASEFDRNGSISISAKDGAGLSLVEYTDQVESWLKDDNAQDITLDYYDDSPGVWFEYAIGDTAGFWLFHVFDDGTVVDVIYTFPADQFEAGRDIAYRSFESFSVGVQ